MRVEVKGRVDLSKPGADLLGKVMEVVSAGTLRVETDDGSRWGTTNNGGYNYSVGKCGCNEPYQDGLYIVRVG